MRLLHIHIRVLLLAIYLLMNTFPMTISAKQLPKEIDLVKNTRNDLLAPNASGTWALVSPPFVGGVLTTSVPVKVNASGHITVTVIVTTDVSLTPFTMENELTSEWKVIETGQKKTVSAIVIGPNSAVITATFPLTMPATTVTFDLIGSDKENPSVEILLAPETFRINKYKCEGIYCFNLFTSFIASDYRYPCNNPTADWCEPNSTLATAFNGLPFNQSIEARVNLNTDRRDYYTFNLTDTRPYTFTINSTDTSGDLDIYLYDRDTAQQRCQSNTSKKNAEQIVFIANKPPCNMPAGKKYDLLVYLFSATNPSANISYTLQVQH